MSDRVNEAFQKVLEAYTDALKSMRSDDAQVLDALLADYFGGLCEEEESPC